MNTNLQLSLRMPAEWEPHEAMWIAWPYDEISFPDLAKVEAAIVAVIQAISVTERVELLVLSEAMQRRAEQMLAQAGVDLKRIRFRTMEYANAWMRDCGPIFVKNSEGEILLTKWGFNVWGNKFPDLLIDQHIPEAVQSWLNLPMVTIESILEGGAIDVNGKGMCLTTEQCLLNPNRNPGMSKTEMEAVLREYLGVEKAIWLKNGLYNDHTDGHIDEIARFVNENTIVCAYEDNPEDENYQTLHENFTQLTLAVDLSGRPFNVVKLPMPHIYYASDKPFEGGEKAPVSYTNFYIGNGVVLAAVFNDPNDEAALNILRSVFPQHKVVAIDCSDIIYGGGAIHCLTQQQPTQ